jgi:hypothetical protein
LLNEKKRELTNCTGEEGLKMKFPEDFNEKPLDEVRFVA